MKQLFQRHETVRLWHFEMKESFVVSDFQYIMSGNKTIEQQNINHRSFLACFRTLARA